MSQQENTIIPPQTKTRYTLGLAFRNNPENREKQVLLIKKERPDWRKGKLNGVGGKIEKSETSTECMVREFGEETGILTLKHYWNFFCTLHGNDCEVNVYHTDLLDSVEPKQLTYEKPDWYYVKDLYNPGLKHLYMKNIPWLVAMALSEDTIFANVEYTYP